MGEETEKLVSTGADEAPAREAHVEEPDKSPAEKITEEGAAASDEQEEKHAEAIEKAEDKTIDEAQELIPPIEEGPAAAPFVEESYYVKDLKDNEKKALQDLKAKIAELIQKNTFLAPPNPAVVARREVELEKEEKKEEEKEGEKKAEQDEGKKGEVGERGAPVEGASEEKTTAEGASATTDKPECKDTPAVAITDTPATNDTPASLEGSPVAVEGTPPVKELVEEEKKVVPTCSAEGTPVSHDRVMVPEAEDDTPSLEDLAIWGVPLLHTKGDERTDVILLKFLRARDFKANNAMSMLKDTVIWRKEFNADNLVHEKIATEFDSVAYMYGVDKEGHPVCYNHYGIFQDKELYQKTFGDEAQFKKFLRWRIQVLEKGLQKLDFSPSGVHSMVQVFDLRDSLGFVKSTNITRKAFNVLLDNYPELVAKQIFVNVPWYFGALYSLHGKFITARSKSKIVKARPEKVTETLFKYIRPEDLPVRYGGFGRSSDTDFEGVEAPVKEVTLKAGEKQILELPEQEVGSTVVWDVVVVGWEVIYGEEFVPTGEGKYTVIIQKPKKVTAAEEPLRNSFKATTDPGKVVITIENTTRRKKLVAYRCIIKGIPGES